MRTEVLNDGYLINPPPSKEKYDKQRTKELIELGWKVVIIDRNNWSSVHNIVKQEILNKLKEIRCV